MRRMCWSAIVACALFLPAITSSNAMDAEMLKVMMMHPGPGGRQTPMATPIPRQTVAYTGTDAPGTIIVATAERRLYLVLPGHMALKYGVGVARPGFEWGGTVKISAKREYPTWTPPASMLRRRPDLPHFMKGGPQNPLGERAMYLGSTQYRIHGSNEPETIGHAMSSGCIRMTNADVKDLYARVQIGATVHILQ